MSDHYEIEGLMFAYASRYDSGDLAGWARLFDRGTLTSGYDGISRTGVGLLEYISARSIIHADGTPRTSHLMTNIRIDAEPDGLTANAVSYVSVFQQTETLPLQVVCAGTYADAFHKVDGKWHFRDRRLTLRLIGDMSQHQRTPA